MPTYEYTCDSCSTVTERIVAVSKRDDGVPCDCGGTLGRNITAPGWVWAPTRNR